MEDHFAMRLATWDSGLMPTSWWWAAGLKPAKLGQKIEIGKHGENKGGSHQPHPLSTRHLMDDNCGHQISSHQKWASQVNFFLQGFFPLQLFPDVSFEIYIRLECPLKHPHNSVESVDINLYNVMPLRLRNCLLMQHEVHDFVCAWICIWSHIIMYANWNKISIFRYQIDKSFKVWQYIIKLWGNRDIYCWQKGKSVHPLGRIACFFLQEQPSLAKRKNLKKQFEF